MRRLVKVPLSVPLYAQILGASGLGALLGLALGHRADALKPVSDIVLQLLRLLATPLVLLSLLHALLRTDIRHHLARRLALALLANTVLAIGVGLLASMLFRPGEDARLAGVHEAPAHASTLASRLLSRVPKDWISPIQGNDIVGVVILGLAVGLALRSFRGSSHERRVATLSEWTEFGLDLTRLMLRWVIACIPLAVLAAAAWVVGTSSLDVFESQARFVMAVCVALAFMFPVYLIRVRLSSRVGPVAYLSGGLDAFLTAFSTSSSIATMPVTYECATSKIGLDESCASLGIFVGGTFNHDGGALFQTMAALFVSQTLGLNLSPAQIALLALLAVFSSVATAGIPQGGLVMMVAIFSTLGLPVEYAALLLPLDLILDRARTAINVAGDLAATCIADMGSGDPATMDDSAMR